MAETCCICDVKNPEWVGYGSCGHRNLCSTCVARSRFLHQDLRCYSCMTQRDIVFITKAYGDLKERIKNFPTFLPNPKEGQVGKFWYHADTKAFFDDYNEYKRIKELCRVKCICDRKLNFNCVGALMTHLHVKHKAYLCTICLVSRDLFISEQKPFTWYQLNQHIRTGDTVADRSSLVNGKVFTGHPYCELCRNPFYGDKQVYVHLSTGSCTCHICIRLYPILHRDDEEVEDHFCKYHIREDDQYWNDHFSIVKAFNLQKDLEKHKANVHGQSTSKNPYESFRREPVYEYTHSFTVPPIYCPPLVSQYQASSSSSSLNTTQSYSYQDQSRRSRQNSEISSRFGMNGTPLASSLNTTQLDISSSSRGYLGHTQAQSTSVDEISDTRRYFNYLETLSSSEVESELERLCQYLNQSSSASGNSNG